MAKTRQGQGIPWNQAWDVAKTFWQLTHEAPKQSLPKAVQQRVHQYFWSWEHLQQRLQAPDEAKRVLLSLKGPLAIKVAQNQAQGLQGILPILEATADKGLSLPPSDRWQDKILLPIASLGSQIMAKNALARYKTLSPLLNTVPLLPRPLFEPQLKELQGHYNQRFPNDPIVAIRDAEYSGSVGQIFPAETRSGQRLVMKVARPDVTPEFLAGCKSSLYTQNLVLRGTTPAAQRQAAQDAENQIRLLLGEADYLQESRNMQALARAMAALNIHSFKVPEVRLATSAGLILPYIGQADLKDLSPEARQTIQRNIAPDFLKLLLLSPVKPLDPHSGNFRCDGTTPPFLIDHGRTAVLDDATHRQLLKLLVLTYRHPDATSLLQDKAWREAAAALAPDNTDFQQALKALPPNADGEHPAAQKVLGSLKPIFSPSSDSLDTLLKAVLEALQENAPKGDAKTLPLSLKFSESSLKDWLQESPLRLFSLWGAYQAQPAWRRLGGEALSQKDLNRSEAHWAKLAQGYFFNPRLDRAEQENIQAVEQLSLREFFDTFANPYGKEVFAPISGKIDLPLFEAFGKAFAARNPKEKAGLEQAFRHRLADILKTDSPTRRKLLFVYQVQARCREQAQQLTQALLEATGETVSPGERKTLTRNVLTALKRDCEVDNRSIATALEAFEAQPVVSPG